eukprot:197817_1
MSRHRNVRDLYDDYDDDYHDDYYEEEEEDLTQDPSASQYIFQRGQPAPSTGVGYNYGLGVAPQSLQNGTHPVSSGGATTCSPDKMAEYVAEISAIVGDEFSREAVEKALQKSNFDTETALAFLLDEQDQAEDQFQFSFGANNASAAPKQENSIPSSSPPPGFSSTPKPSESTKTVTPTAEPLKSSPTPSHACVRECQMASPLGVALSQSQGGHVPSVSVGQSATSFSVLAEQDRDVESLEKEVSRFGFNTPSPDDIALQDKHSRLMGRGRTQAAPTTAKSPNPLPEPKSSGQTASPKPFIKKVDSKKILLKSLKTAGTGSGEGTSPSYQSRGLKPFTEGVAAKRALKRRELLENERTSDSKSRINMIVCGHVDAGKSTLMGHLLYRLGNVTKTQMHRFQKDSRDQGKASFAFAWVMDAHAEERERGVTVDVGVQHFETEHRRVTVLDSPGHRDFIPAMLTGAAQADVAVLVVDSTPGEFEAGFQDGGQTKEHAILVRSLGVTQVIVAVNKMDTIEWSQVRYNSIVSEITQFLKSQSFKEKNIFSIPVSGFTGENMIDCSEPNLKEWYSGPTLIDQIDRFKPPSRPVDKHVRLSVSDVYHTHALGTAVSGKLFSGSVMAGDRLLILPANMLVAVKALARDGEPCSVASAGDHIEIGLSNVEDPNMLAVGQLLCDPSKPVPMVTKFRAQIVTLGLRLPLLKGQKLVLHLHNIDRSCQLSKISNLLDRDTGQVVKRKPRFIGAKQSCTVDIITHRQICLELFKEFKHLGRFLLRREGQTVAVGIVSEFLS